MQAELDRFRDNLDLERVSYRDLESPFMESLQEFSRINGIQYHMEIDNCDGVFHIFCTFNNSSLSLSLFVSKFVQKK